MPGCDSTPISTPPGDAGIGWLCCPFRALLHLATWADRRRTFELEALYGGFAGEPFTDDSTEYVFVARRPLTR